MSMNDLTIHTDETGQVSKVTINGVRLYAQAISVECAAPGVKSDFVQVADGYSRVRIELIATVNREDTEVSA